MPNCPEMASSTPTSSVPVHEPIPSSPPPSYEHVLAETAAAAAAATATATETSNETSRETATENSGETNGEEEEEEEDGQREGESQGNVDGNASPLGREILYKSSKELYRAVAAQWGITCKMSDHCRCLDCQSRYFDCEYDQNEQEKTDGGLGAGTPMFISEVMHGTACIIL